jgi:hypothetical protein
MNVIPVPTVLYMRMIEKSKAEDLETKDSSETFNKLIAEAKPLNGNSTRNDRTTGVGGHREGSGYISS